MFRYFIFAAVFALAGCVTVGEPFSQYPNIEPTKGQLVLFNRRSEDSKIDVSADVLCNGILCANVINAKGLGGGSYSIQNFPPGKVQISILENQSWALGPKILMQSNKLDVDIQEGKRIVVQVKLLSGRESYFGNTLNSATHQYQIFLVPEDKALQQIIGLKRPRGL